MRVPYRGSGNETDLYCLDHHSVTGLVHPKSCFCFARGCFVYVSLMFVFVYVSLMFVFVLFMFVFVLLMLVFVYGFLSTLLLNQVHQP